MPSSIPAMPRQVTSALAGRRTHSKSRQTSISAPDQRIGESPSQAKPVGRTRNRNWTTLGQRLDLGRGVGGAVAALRPVAASRAHARCSDGSASSRLTASRTPRGGDKPARQRHARAGPGDARRVLGHVARGRAGHAPARRRPARAPASRGPAWQTTAAQQRHRRARTRPTRPAARSAAPASGRGGGAAVVGGQHAHRLAGRAPRAPRRACRCSGSCAVDGATSTSGSSPGGSSTSPNGRSHISGPVTRAHGGQPRARVLELGERRDDRELARDPAVQVVDRRQPDALARAVELVAALLDSLAAPAGRAAATTARRARARMPRADRVGREAAARRSAARAAPASPRAGPRSAPPAPTRR